MLVQHVALYFNLQLEETLFIGPRASPAVTVKLDRLMGDKCGDRHRTHAFFCPGGAYGAGLPGSMTAYACSCMPGESSFLTRLITS